MKQNIKREYKR